MNTIVIADDHEFSLIGTVDYVGSLGYQVVGSAKSGMVALNLILRTSPSIAIIDINMPGLNGLDLLKSVNAKKVMTRFVFLTMHKELSIYETAMKLGAKGYVLKEHARSELQKCLEVVSQNGIYVSETLKQELVQDDVLGTDTLKGLTFTERKIVELIAQQKTTKQIAELLFISTKTIEGHRTNIIEKLKLPKEKNALMKWALTQKHV
jgi:DNA-binding NarL/FixJ family response regulator